MPLITDAQVAQFHEQGFFVTEPMWPASELNQVAGEFNRLHQEEIRRCESSSDPLALEFARFRPFIGQAHTRSDVLKRFVRSPIYLEACQKLIGPDADLYYNQVVIKPPEKGRSFGWHQDSGYVKTEPLRYITCWTAISRTFVENGCIWIIPRSHHWGLLDHPRNAEQNELQAQFKDESGAIPVEMRPGQVAIFSSLMLHKSGANTSNEVRRGYVPQYHVPNVINVQTKAPWGDLYPVLRGGKPVA